MRTGGIKNAGRGGGYQKRRRGRGGGGHRRRGEFYEGGEGELNIFFGPEIATKNYGSRKLLFSARPTYRLWPFSSTKKIIPKCPFGIPRMKIPEFLGSAFSLALLFALFNRKPNISWNFPAFLWRGLLGSPHRVFGGR